MWSLIGKGIAVLSGVIPVIYGVINWYYPGSIQEFFSPAPTANLTVSPSSWNLITITGDGINCGYDCSQDYKKNDTVTLSAQVAEGKRLVWTGSCYGIETKECILIMDDHKSVGVVLR